MLHFSAAASADVLAAVAVLEATRKLYQRVTWLVFVTVSLLSITSPSYNTNTNHLTTMLPTVNFRCSICMRVAGTGPPFREFKHATHSDSNCRNNAMEPCRQVGPAMADRNRVTFIHWHLASEKRSSALRECINMFVFVSL